MQQDDRLRYYDTKKISWYDLMGRLCGGRMDTGEHHTNSFNTETSVMHNHSDSSNDPRDEEPVYNETEGTVQQEISYVRGSLSAHTSPGGISTSCSSGSQKRKNTDDNAEPSRGQKTQKRFLSKVKGFNS
jgi:hypothetical protein